MTTARFQGEVSLRTGGILDPRYVVVTDQCVNLYNSAEDAASGDDRLLQSAVALKDVTAVEVQDSAVTLVAGDRRVSLAPTEDVRYALLRIVQTSVQELQQVAAAAGGDDGVMEESNEEEQVDVEESEEHGGQATEGDGGTAEDDDLPVIVFSGDLLVEGRARRFFVLTNDAFFGFKNETDARDEKSFPFMEMPLSMVQGFQSTEKGFLLQFGSSKEVEFHVADTDTHEAWITAWASLGDPEIEHYGEVIRRISTWQSNAVDSLISRKLLSRGMSFRPTSLMRNLAAMLEPLPENIDENAQATGMFDTAVWDANAVEPGRSGSLRRWAELVNGRLLLYDLTEDTQKIEPPAYALDLAQVSEVEVPIDNGFIMKLAGGGCFQLWGPVVGRFDEWLRELEAALSGGESEAAPPGKNSNGILDEVMPPTVVPLMVGLLEVCLPGESETFLRQVVLQRDVLKIFATKQPDEQPVADVPLEKVDHLQVSNNRFSLGTRDRTEYTFVTQDNDNLMSWVNSWRSVIDGETQPAVGQLHRDTVLHEGPAYIDCAGIRKASYAVVYVSRVEFLEDPTQKPDRSVPRRVVWPEDVRDIEINIDGFTIGFDSGAIEVEVPAGEDLAPWTRSLTTMMQPIEESGGAASAKSAETWATRVSSDASTRQSLHASGDMRAQPLRAGAEQDPKAPLRSLRRAKSSGRPQSGAASGRKSLARAASVDAGAASSSRKVAGVSRGHASTASRQQSNLVGAGRAQTLAADFEDDRGQDAGHRGLRRSGVSNGTQRSPIRSADSGVKQAQSEDRRVIRPNDDSAKSKSPAPAALVPLARSQVATAAALPPQAASEDGEILLEGELFLTEPARAMVDGHSAGFGGVGGAQPAGSWRSARLYRDRLECWNPPAVIKKRLRAPDITISVADIANVDLDTSAGTMSLTMRSCKDGALEVRRAHFNNVQELGKWSVAILGLMQGFPREAPQVRKKMCGPQNDRKQPVGWVPRCATLEPKGDAKANNGMGPSWKAKVHRCHRGFIVATARESDPSALGQDFRGARSAAKPMSDDLKNNAIAFKVNRRRASVKIWPPEKPLTSKINDQRMPLARKDFTWTKITNAPDGLQVARVR